MKFKQEAAYRAALESAQDKFNEEVAVLADRIRTETIIPLCRKHKLTFISGMGTFFFTDSKGRNYGDYLYRDGGNARIFEAVKRVLQFLNEEVSHNQCLGYFVDDVRVGDTQ